VPAGGLRARVVAARRRRDIVCYYSADDLVLFLTGSGRRQRWHAGVPSSDKLIDIGLVHPAHASKALSYYENLPGVRVLKPLAQIVRDHWQAAELARHLAGESPDGV